MTLNRLLAINAAFALLTAAGFVLLLFALGYGFWLAWPASRLPSSLA